MKEGWGVHIIYERSHSHREVHGNLALSKDLNSVGYLNIETQRVVRYKRKVWGFI